LGGLIVFLSRAEPRAAPEATAGAIFVFAGGQARKEYAVAAWRRGHAPVLVLSVARFEWRRYALLGLPGMERLQAAVERLPPPERHFFVILERGTAEIRHVVPRRYGTRNEARALSALARQRGWKSLIVISSEFHLRRVALVVGRAFRGSGIAVAYAAPPPGTDPHGPGRWWRSRRGVRLVGSEILKLFRYTFLKP
jgi:uncharacterized SAM-binding protein YcdF (DUF218 family)